MGGHTGKTFGLDEECVSEAYVFAHVILPSVVVWGYYGTLGDAVLLEKLYH